MKIQLLIYQIFSPSGTQDSILMIHMRVIATEQGGKGVCFKLPSPLTDLDKPAQSLDRWRVASSQSRITVHVTCIVGMNSLDAEERLKPLFYAETS